MTPIPHCAAKLTENISRFTAVLARAGQVVGESVVQHGEGEHVDHLAEPVQRPPQIGSRHAEDNRGECAVREREAGREQVAREDAAAGERCREEAQREHTPPA